MTWNGDTLRNSVDQDEIALDNLIVAINIQFLP